MNIDRILEDCYAIDPSLKEHGPELRRAVEKLLSAKPDAKPDAAFVANLREQVLDLAGAEPLHAMKFDLKDFFSFRLPLPAGTVIAAALVLVVAGSIVPGMTSQRPSSNDGKLAATDSSKTTKLADRDGFGSLSGSSGLSPESAPNPSRPMAAGLGGGGGNLGSPAAISVAAPMMDSKMIAPADYVQYRYVYKGELPAAPDADITVLRRMKGFASGSIPSAGADANALIDLSRLSSAKLQSYAVVEDREFGLIASIDAVEGAVNLSQNWIRWPHPENQCRDEACWLQYRISPDQVPADDAVIAVAERFLQEYGISKNGLGTPEVRSEWRVMYAAATVKKGYSAPESLSVVYPYLVEGAAVVDEGGATAGVQLNVNLRHMRVDGLWNLVGRRFESSAYAAETDVSRLLKVAERGGTWGGWVDPNAKVVDLELGAPELVYLRTWKARDDGSSDDLFVPAWRFSVLNKPADQPWFRGAVVIPLAKELLDAADAQFGGGVPMPLMGRTEGAVTMPAPDPAVR